jgi:S-adenosylmethionine decarboxylase proenzyme
MGIHVIAEFFGVEEGKISRVNPLRGILERIVSESGLRPIHSAFHQFEPYGVSGFFLLRESHLSVHTWPEYRYVAVDIFSCGPEQPALKALNLLIERLNPKSVKKRIIRRDPFEKS